MSNLIIKNSLQGAILNHHVCYWKKKLDGYKSLNIITDKIRPQKINNIYDSFRFELDVSTSEALRKLSKTLKVSLFSCLLSGYYLMLRVYSKQNDIVVGCPLVQYRHCTTSLNLLPLRVKINENSKLGDFIRAVEHNVIEAQLYRQLKFEQLVQALNIPNDINKLSIFQVMFAVENTNTLLDQKNNLENVEHTSKKINIPEISMFIDDSKFILSGILNFTIDLYTKGTIKYFVETYTEILQQFLQLANIVQHTAHTKISELHYLNKQQWQQIIHTWNNTDKASTNHQTIHELFETQVLKTPNDIAVVYENTNLTYNALNAKTNQLAHYLRSICEIKADIMIVLCLSRSEYILISILAILKAGGAYVPVDPNCPNTRLQHIIKDTNAQVILTNITHKNKLESIVNNTTLNKQQINIIAIDSEEILKQLLLQSKSNPCVASTDTNLAYVIYTSGTTGNPKGVMVEHKGVVNYTRFLISNFGYCQNDKHILISEYIFDLGYTAVWGSVLIGGELHIVQEQCILSPVHLIEYITTRKISVIKTTPLYFRLLMNYSQEHSINFLNHVNKIIFGGEKLTHDILDWFANNHNSVLVFNHYGPTETTIGCIAYKINHDKKVKHISNFFSIIGSPISNTKAYVLDSTITPLPIGAIGELHISGVGLARGYLNLPDLTAKKFIPNPFQTIEDKVAYKNTKLYKTGDLVRWKSDGNLEYIGRNDSQVKIHGYRIELSEIENVLKEHGDVLQAVVIIKTTDDAFNNKKLIAYIVYKEFIPSPTELKEFLLKKLPEYMIPSFIVCVDSLPLTLNGKLNVEALPDPKIVEFEYYVAPRNNIEQDICNIWAEIFGIAENKVGIQNNFFNLGGDSIAGIRCISRIRQHLGLNVSLKDIFHYKTIERLYDNILSKAFTHNIQLDLKTEQGILSGDVLLLPIQRLFFRNNHIKPNHWNQSFIIKVPNLEIEKLQWSIKRLIEYHDNFRLRYKKSKDSVSTQNTSTKIIQTNYIQYYDSNAKIEGLKILDIRTLKVKEGSKKFKIKLQEILTNWQSNFNLENGPTYSVGYIYGYADGSSRIYFALHHLIIDAVSWRILTEDLRDIYNQKTLSPKGGSYRQWAIIVEEYANINQAEKDYWTNILAGYSKNSNKLIELVINEHTKNHVIFSLSAKKTQQLLYMSNKTYNTQINDILLTALGNALYAITNDRTNYIILEGHGREEISNSIDISRTAGWFTIKYPVRLDIGDDIRNSLRIIKENLRQIPNKGIGYGILMRDEEISLLTPRVNFNYLGQFDQSEEKSNKQNLWSIVNEDSGITVHPLNNDCYIININGYVIGHSLEFSIDSKLEIDITNKLAKVLQDKLEEVIDHTVYQNRSYLTVSDIDNIISQALLDRLQNFRELECVYLANSLQQNFICHDLKYGDIDDAYIVQTILQYNYPLNIDQFKEAWNSAQQKYPTLRLRFDWQEELVQIIDKIGVLNWQYIDLSQENYAFQELHIQQVQQDDRKKWYNLTQGHLFRLYLIKQRDDLYTCIFSNHHSILDGWSKPILLKYVHETYSYLKKEMILLPKTDYSYVEAQKYLQDHRNDDKDYWKQYMLQIKEYCDLHWLYHKDLNLTECSYVTTQVVQKLTIDSKLYDTLKALSTTKCITLNAILQYAWHRALSIYCGSNQTIVGTVVSGRNLPVDGIENSIGLYINILPLIIDHQKQKDKSVLEIIQDIQNNINEMNIRSTVHVCSLQKQEKRLFDSIFIYQNHPDASDFGQKNNLAINFIGEIEKIGNPLEITVHEENAMIIELSYASELFAEDNIKYLLSIMKCVLEQVVLNYEHRIQDINYLTDREYRKIVYNWNKTDNSYLDKKIHDLFEAKVAETPNDIAIVCNQTLLTYQELNTKANQLAHYLRMYHEIKHDTLIILYIDDSVYRLISVLAVLKSGCSYVPISSIYPEQSIMYIINDTCAKVILTSNEYSARIEEAVTTKNVAIDQQIEILAVDNEEIQKQLMLQPQNNLDVPSTDIAYISYPMHTSGNPLGIVVTHDGIVQYITNLQIYKSILFIDQDSELSIIGVISSLYSAACTISKKNNCEGNNLNIIMYNEYNSTISTSLNINKSQLHIDNNLMIGRLCHTYKVYVLDKNLKPMPIGVVGELYIGGIGLARGYLNKPKLTKEKFIVNPFQTEEEKNSKKNLTLYKTGDLVRWLSNGDLEYIGCCDSITRINGYFVELKKIENILLQYQGIKQSAVFALEYTDQKSTGIKYLVSYYVANNNLCTDEILRYMQTKLPEYMIPSFFVHLDKLPLMTGSTIDKNALPILEFVLKDSNTNTLLNNSEIEIQIREIWTQVLGLHNIIIDIKDNFFKLGGNSILAIKLVNKLNSHFQSHIKVCDIFKYKNIKLLTPIIVQTVQK